MSDSTIKSFFEGLGEDILQTGSSYVWEFFGKTKTGAKVEQNISSGIIGSYLQNPIVIVGIVLLVLVIIFFSKKRT